MIDVSIDTEQSLKDNLDDCREVLREWNTYQAREDLLVVELVLHPGHKEVNILGSTDFEWCLDVVPISPEILVFRTCTHGWA